MISRNESHGIINEKRNAGEFELSTKILIKSGKVHRFQYFI